MKIVLYSTFDKDYSLQKQNNMLSVAAVLYTSVLGDISAIASTGYEIGFCTSLPPFGPPPNPPGYWCDDYNRGTEERNCWTATQNCCYLNMNKTVPAYPGMIDFFLLNRTGGLD